MEQLYRLNSVMKSIQRFLTMKDSVTVSLFSGILGTLAMDILNLMFWKKRKTEALYGHIAGSVLVNPLRTNQRKNFLLGQILHLITGAVLAYPLNILLMKTGKDNALIKGAFFGLFTWEFIYGFGQKFKIYTSGPYKTNTHFTELINNIVYGITTVQSLVAFSDPSLYPDFQNKTSVRSAQSNKIEPIYSDRPSDVERSALM